MMIVAQRTHLKNHSANTVRFTIQVDFLGDGSWEEYKVIEVAANGYAHHEFPDGFSAHWVRMITDRDCKATVTFIYS